MNKPNSLPPFKFTPYLKSVIWGGDRIAQFKGLRDAPGRLGESWEISAIPGKESVVSEGPDAGLRLSELIGRYGADLVGHEAADAEFPLLIKLIDAQRDLSIQVHPDDAMANQAHGCMGKTEMWYIIDNDPGASVYAGFSTDLDSEAYFRHVADGTIVDCITVHPSEPGTVFFLPPGRIHAIGAGNFLIEIQRSSDVTYRVYDYNRLDSDGKPRELHLQQAHQALDLKATPPGEVRSLPVAQGSGVLPISQCQYFRVSRLTVEGSLSLSLDGHDSFVTLTVIAGTLRLRVPGQRALRLGQGETALIPACASAVDFKGNAIAVTATLP